MLIFLKRLSVYVFKDVMIKKIDDQKMEGTKKNVGRQKMKWNGNAWDAKDFGKDKIRRRRWSMNCIWEGILLIDNDH